MKKQLQKIQTKAYTDSLNSIISRFEDSRHKAISHVNKLLIELYWFIGEAIIHLQEEGKWGDAVVEKLSKDLRIKYPEQGGFSSRNLWDCKRLYLAYKDYPKLRTVFAEISWSHNLLLLNKTDNIQEKEFYLKMAFKEKWSFRELQRQIESAFFERYMISQKPENLNPAEKALAPEKDAQSCLKDEYVLEFLGLSETFTEKELRKAILSNFRDFFLEFGKDLSFIGEEYPLIVDGEEFRVDLLFFHREIQCLVAVELKISEFKPEYMGKMQFYLAALNEQVRHPHENPSIGLILCRSKRESVVRLTLANTSNPIKISTYQTKLPDKKLIEQRLNKIKLI